MYRHLHHSLSATASGLRYHESPSGPNRGGTVRSDLPSSNPGRRGFAVAIAKPSLPRSASSSILSTVAHRDHHERDSAAVRVGVVTVSDTRSEGDDTSGRRIRELAAAAGHEVVFYKIVRDEPESIVGLIRLPPSVADVIITNGGTGLAPRDTTFEAVSRLIQREIPGFGEIFRTLSYAEVGAAAMLSRAVAGLVGDRVVFCLPGSTKAVELAMVKLILPQIGHLVGLVGRR
jgi:molybdenum cofactor biosynthesis protein B